MRPDDLLNKKIDFKINLDSKSIFPFSEFPIRNIDINPFFLSNPELLNLISENLINENIEITDYTFYSKKYNISKNYNYIITSITLSNGSLHQIIDTNNLEFKNINYNYCFSIIDENSTYDTLNILELAGRNSLIYNKPFVLISDKHNFNSTNFFFLLQLYVKNKSINSDDYLNFNVKGIKMKKGSEG